MEAEVGVGAGSFNGELMVDMAITGAFKNLLTKPMILGNIRT